MALCTRAMVVAALSCAVVSCRSTPVDGDRAAPTGALVDGDKLARPMFEDGIASASKLLEEDQPGAARRLIEELLAQSPPPELQPKLTELLRQARRAETAAAHKLVLSVVPRERELCFGEVAVFDLTIQNAGSSRLDVPGETGGLFVSLGLESPEQSQVRLHRQATSFDGVGSQWSETGSEDRVLSQDVSLGPGETFTWTQAVPLGQQGRAIYRVIEVEAVLRPIAVMSDSGSAHYYPIRSSPARVVVWPDERWRNHRLTAEQVQAALQDGDPALAFLALASCTVAERRAAIASSLQLLTRLPDGCRRTTFAALRYLTGREMGLDVERWRAWWQAEGQYLDYSWGAD